MRLEAILISLFMIGCSLLAAGAEEAASSWERAATLQKATEQDVQSTDILSVERHRDELELALAGANTSIADAAAHNVVLTDGTSEVVTALGSKIADRSRSPKNIEAIQNPYPAIAFYLGSYYDEIGKPEDAVRVIDLGLSTFAVSGIDLGAHTFVLLGEKGAALNTLHHSEDALACYDRALKISDEADIDRARLERGRGFSLTELNRLDEAEVAYRDSLKLAPGNERAEHELTYIGQLKAGHPVANGYLASVRPGQAPTAPTASPTEKSMSPSGYEKC